jgi:hypothetical protein
VKRARARGRDSTPVALAVSVLCGATAFYLGEVLYNDLAASGSPDISAVPSWRGHMAAACIGAIVLAIALFFLERMGGRSNAHAMRLVVPWLPLGAITGLATVVHVPAFLVVTAMVLYSSWAYRAMRWHDKPDRF